MNRRKFLFSSLLLGVAGFLKFDSLARFYGDGVRNDAEAFAAVFAGKEAIGPDGNVVKIIDGILVLPKGNYVVDGKFVFWPENLICFNYHRGGLEYKNGGGIVFPRRKLDMNH